MHAHLVTNEIMEKVTFPPLDECDDEMACLIELGLSALRVMGWIGKRDSDEILWDLAEATYYGICDHLSRNWGTCRSPGKITAVGAWVINLAELVLLFDAEEVA